MPSKLRHSCHAAFDRHPRCTDAVCSNAKHVPGTKLCTVAVLTGNVLWTMSTFAPGQKCVHLNAACRGTFPYRTPSHHVNIQLCPYSAVSERHHHARRATAGRHCAPALGQQRVSLRSLRSAAEHKTMTVLSPDVWHVVIAGALYGCFDSVATFARQAVFLGSVTGEIVQHRANSGHTT